MPKGKGRGWHGEPGRHSKAARGIKTAKLKTSTRVSAEMPTEKEIDRMKARPWSGRIKPKYRKGQKTIERLQSLSDTLWYDKGFLSNENRDALLKEMKEIQEVIGPHRVEHDGKMVPINVSEFYNERGYPKDPYNVRVEWETAPNEKDARAFVHGTMLATMGTKEWEILAVEHVGGGLGELVEKTSPNKLYRVTIVRKGRY